MRFGSKVEPGLNFWDTTTYYEYVGSVIGAVEVNCDLVRLELLYARLAHTAKVFSCVWPRALCYLGFGGGKWARRG